jgi:hypothetical protein
MDRRSFLRGLIAAPAIVTFGNLMPVRGMPLSGLMLHHKVLTAPEVLELYGRSPGMDALDGLPSLRELEAMKARILNYWDELAKELWPNPISFRINRNPHSPPARPARPGAGYRPHRAGPHGRNAEP